MTATAVIHTIRPYGCHASIADPAAGGPSMLASSKVITKAAFAAAAAAEEAAAAAKMTTGAIAGDFEGGGDGAGVSIVLPAPAAEESRGPARARSGNWGDDAFDDDEEFFANRQKATKKPAQTAAERKSAELAAATDELNAFVFGGTS